MILDNVTCLCKAHKTSIWAHVRELGNGVIGKWASGSLRVKTAKIVADSFGVTLDALLNDKKRRAQIIFIEIKLPPPLSNRGRGLRKPLTWQQCPQEDDTTLPVGFQDRRYSYHGRILQRIRAGELDRSYYTQDYPRIGGALVLVFRAEPFSRPIRPHRWGEYQEIVTTPASVCDTIQSAQRGI